MLPGAYRCVAEIAGESVGMASLILLKRVGYLTTCGVLPKFRHRGVQAAT